MNLRHFVPLSLIYHAENKIAGTTKLMHLAFLANEALDNKGISLYTFSATDHGPFSHTLQETLNDLEQEGHISIDITHTIGGSERHNYSLTATTKTTFQEQICPQFESDASNDELNDAATIHQTSKHTVQQYDIPVSNLVNQVQKLYPKYTTDT